MIYSEFVSWSPIYGDEVSRLSMVNERNEEYFCMLPHGDGKGFRDLRKKAVAKLAEAIEMEIGPGEIRWR